MAFKNKNLFGSTILLLLASGTTNATPFVWSNAVYGGGGFVDGLLATGEDVYIRTDVGGAYRLSDNGTRWLSLTDLFGYQDRNLYGG